MKTLLVGVSLMLAILACGEGADPATETEETAPDTAEVVPEVPEDLVTEVPEVPADTVDTPVEPDTVIHAAVDAELTFDLDANPTTGYHWVLKCIDQEGEIVRLADEPDYVPDDHPEGMTGVGGTEVWKFMTVAPGEALVRLAYTPPGEGGEPGRLWSARIVVE